MRKVKTILLMALYSLILVSCNVGGGGNDKPESYNLTAEPNLQADLKDSQSNALPESKIHFTNTGIRSFHPRKSSSRSIVSNPDKTDTEDPIYSSVGWITALDDYAPKSCWDYNISLIGSSGTSEATIAQNRKDLQHHLGITSSTMAKFDSLSSISAAVDFEGFYGSSKQSVTIGTTSITSGIAGINILGLNSIGESVLKNNPSEFIQICGDKIVTQVPIEVSASFMLNYIFQSLDENEELNIIVGSSGPFLDTLNQINTATRKSQSAVTISQTMPINGKVDTNVIEDASMFLSSCINMDEYSEGLCITGLTTMSTATSSGFQEGVDLISQSKGKNVVWQSIFATTYDASSKFRFIDTIDELNSLGIKIQPKPNRFETYKAQIIRNTKVLQDLKMANYLLNKIFAGIKELPYDFARNFTPYRDNLALANKYHDALLVLSNNLQSDINQCVTSSYTGDVDSACSKLDPKIEVAKIMEQKLENDPNVPLLKPAIINTVKSLIYTDDVIRDKLYPNKMSSVLSETNSLIVYMPAKQFDRAKKRSNFIIATIPANISTQYATINGEEVPIYIGAYQSASPIENQVFWGPWDDFSQARSGAIGYYNSNREILYPYVNRSDYNNSIESIGSSETQVCKPFDPQSNGCKYIVKIHMDPSVITNIKKPVATVKQIIIDDFNPTLVPSGTDRYGTNRFATLYPGQEY